MKIINRREALKKSFLWSVGIFTASTFELLFDSCNWSAKPKISLDFSPFQKKVIAEIAEIFIPATDTPGAKDLHLEDFIIYFIKDCTVIPAQEAFIMGLNSFIEKAQNNYGKNFLELNTAEKEKLVSEEDESSFSLLSLVKRKVFNYVPTFFQTMKDLTVFGYCTSEEGATMELSFLPVPGQYIPCQTIKPGQKAWAISD